MGRFYLTKQKEFYCSVYHRKPSERIFFKAACFKVVKCSISNFILTSLHVDLDMYACDEKCDVKEQVVITGGIHC